MAERIFNVLCATMFILVFAPFYLLIAVIIVCCSPGNPIYKAKRVGKDGKVFTLYKFRSMRTDSGQIRITTLHNDNRVFPFGKFLRNTKLDETPQIFNILKQDMSIVGFRPEDEINAKEIFKDDFSRILTIKPGLTSPASLFDYTHGELYDDEDQYIREILPIKMEMELYYTENKTFLYDIKLIFRTVLIIVLKIFGKKEFPYPPEYPIVVERLKLKKESKEITLK